MKELAEHLRALILHRGDTGAPFRINLSSQYRGYVAPARLCLMGLALALVLGFVWDLRGAWEAKAHVARVQPALLRVLQQDRQFLATAQKDGLDLSAGRLAKLPNDVAFANRLIVERAFSWTRLLGELEQSVPSDLAITGIQHDLGQSVTIRLSGSARGLENVTEFTKALTDHAAFYDPLLVNHRVRSDNGFVEFNLVVGYRWQT